MHLSFAAQTRVGAAGNKGHMHSCGMSQTETDSCLDPLSELPGKGLSLLHFEQQNYPLSFPRPTQSGSTAPCGPPVVPPAAQTISIHQLLPPSSMGFSMNGAEDSAEEHWGAPTGLSIPLVPLSQMHTWGTNSLG